MIDCLCINFCLISGLSSGIDKLLKANGWDSGHTAVPFYKKHFVKNSQSKKKILVDGNSFYIITFPLDISFYLFV